ncbi:MAG: QacE family quaternary ammonium compound efflux SMR transporter [Chloroflexi bacterium]|nr:MAG: QacE family quaternary ammonium compound efflux SMR transporter [Chloroflexota bacterium]
MSVHWLFLAGAIVLEVMGTTSMKLSQGLTKPFWSIAMFVFYAASFSLFAKALEKLDVGMSYAIWSGVGTVAIVTIGFFVFEEQLSFSKAAAIVLIIIGVVWLNLASGNAHS